MRPFSFLIILIATATLGLQAHSQDLDLTKGFGKFTWGMPFTEALNLANDAHGSATVRSSAPQPAGPPLPGMPSRLPQTVARQFARLPGESSFQRQKLDYIQISSVDSELTLNFFNGHLYQISKSINRPIPGYITSGDINTLKIPDKLKTRIKIDKGIVIEGSDFAVTNSMEINHTTFLTAAHIYFTAINNNIFDAELSKLRATNPNLESLFLTPLLTP